MTERIEESILRNLLHNEEYYRKVIPFLKAEYYESFHERIIYEEIADFAAKYDKVPTKEVLSINIQNRTDLTDESFKDSLLAVRELSDDWVDYDWLLDATEKWCKDRAIYLALMQSIKIADGGDRKLSRDAIPSILQEALAVSFDEHIGHDYIEQATDRYEFYHRKEEKIPFDLEKFNFITKGGLPNKTLNIALAGTGVGKSLFMCNLASTVLLQGRNVLYITLEMAEEKIAERIDANLLDVQIQDIIDIPKPMFEDKIAKLQKKTQGQLIIKEYPTASAHAGHFDSLIKELYLKKDFQPDIIFIDYLNICVSQRYRAGSNINSYTVVKSIAEELRGLAVKHRVPVFSATQTTRGGYGNSDVSLTDTSESFGLPATADLMFALISNDELEEMGQIMVKQLKNRYNDTNTHKKFVVGIDRAKMKLYDVEQSAQEDILESTPTFKYNDTAEKFKPKQFEGWQ